jgi:hypothetical protein
VSTRDDPVLRELVEEFLTCREQAEKYARMRDDAAALLLNRMKPGESFEVATGVGVRVQAPSRRFDPDVARELLTEQEFESICVLVPTAAQAKRMLPGHTVNLISPATGRPSVRVL